MELFAGAAQVIVPREREQVKKYEEETAKKKNAKACAWAKKRKLTQARRSDHQDDAKGSDGADELANTNVGMQFGSNGNKNKRKQQLTRPSWLCNGGSRGWTQHH
jgi:hypothetical protein